MWGQPTLEVRVIFGMELPELCPLLAVDCPHPHARCLWGTALWSVSRPGQVALLPSLPGQGFHTQENNFLVRRLEGSGRSREQDGARVRQEEQRERPGGRAGARVEVSLSIRALTRLISLPALLIPGTDAG